MIDQKNILIGTVLAIALVFILGMLIPFIGGILAMIVASIVVGYLVNENLKKGAVNGALVGFFTGVISILIVYAYYGFSKEIMGIILIFYLVLIPIYVLLGLGGGIIGSVMKTRQQHVEEILKEDDSEEEVSSKDDKEA
jgi:hypothetical protein